MDFPQNSFKQHLVKLSAIFLVSCTMALSGCGLFMKKGDNKKDPYESYNRKIFKFNRSLDKAVLRPVAQGYRQVTPDFIEKGVYQFFTNLMETQVLLNDLIQFRLEHAMRAAWRIAINTTVGIGGLFDVAKHVGFPHHDNDLGATFYHWGWRNSNYTITPFFGPGTNRDSLGSTIETFILTPYRFFHPDTVRYGLAALEMVSRRAHLLKADKALEHAVDPYVLVRNAYFQKRDKLLKGKHHDPDIYEEGKDQDKKEEKKDDKTDGMKDEKTDEKKDGVKDPKADKKDENKSTDEGDDLYVPEE